jgi:beta-mannosidase
MGVRGFVGAVVVLVASAIAFGADAPAATTPSTMAATAPAPQPVVILPVVISPGEQPAGHVPLALPIGELADQPDVTIEGVHRVPLSSNWQFYSDRDAKWFPATVPGDVHLDLLRNGLIADPFYGTNEKALQWISQVPWKYRCTFDVSAPLLAEPSVDLVADGIDTQASIALNGQDVGNVADMFLRYRFDVKSLLKAQGNFLEINFPVGSARETLRKESVEYGWDFSPHFVTSGIYRPIRLEAGPAKRIDFVGVQQVHENGKVTLDLTADVPIKSRLVFDGREVAVGANELVVRDPKLWWPNGMGDHPLYDLYVEPADGQGSGWHRRIGLRTIQLSTPDEPHHAQAFTFIVNGKPVFAKGASVVPPHAFAGAETPQLERDLVDSAADANMNMLRIWSGGVFLLDDFYDRCDERGIMVWEEEQFLIYKDSPAYRAALAPDVRYQAQRLQSHPSLALWCGNNEGELLHRLNINVREKQFDLPRAKGFVFITRRLMPDTLDEVDPTVSWLPSSPHSPWDMLLPFDDKVAGDLHEWAVWHGNASPHEYETSRRPRFTSEYGMESLSSLDLMKQFCPPLDMDMPLHSPTLTLRQKSGGAEGNDRFAVYLDRSYRPAKDFKSLVYLTQLNQARCDSIGTRELETGDVSNPTRFRPGDSDGVHPAGRGGQELLVEGRSADRSAGDGLRWAGGEISDDPLVTVQSRRWGRD